MTTAPQRCNRADPHDAHFHHVGRLVSSCPGFDPPTLERDRVFDTPDYSPESLHLSHAAAFIVRLWRVQEEGRDGPARAQYLVAMGVWRELCGMDEPEALTWAFQIATSVPAVTAVCPPF